MHTIPEWCVTGILIAELELLLRRREPARRSGALEAMWGHRKTSARIHRVLIMRRLLFSGCLLRLYGRAQFLLRHRKPLWRLIVRRFGLRLVA